MLVSPATFLPSHENRGCCGEENSQNVAAEGEICTADYISACCPIFLGGRGGGLFEYIYIFEAIL